jgi:hypothetical protein
MQFEVLKAMQLKTVSDALFRGVTIFGLLGPEDEEITTFRNVISVYPATA